MSWFRRGRNDREIPLGSGETPPTTSTLDGVESTRPEAPVSEHHAPPGSPRANFSCVKCATVHHDLPAQSVRCPVCGWKRGFSRLFDGVQAAKRGRRVSKFIDRQMQPAWEEHSSRQQDAKRFEQESAKALERSWEEAPPKVKEAVAAAGGAPRSPLRGMNAAAAMGSIDPAARMDSRNFTYPMIEARRGSVRPQWHR